MKKNYFLPFMLLFAFFAHAQGAVTTFADIKYWVGTGSNQAAMVVQWNDGKNTDALVWGFRWDGAATGEDMLKAIAKADRRFYSLLYQGTSVGSEIGGLGFDLDGANTKGLYKDANATYPLYPVNGFVSTTAYDFDKYTAIDVADHWQSGWTTNGIWSYNNKDADNTVFANSSNKAASRTLGNGSWDAWNYQPTGKAFAVASTFTAVSPYAAKTDFTQGFFMVNEEWFGHTNGSVNFVDNDGNINYRVYSDANNNQAFGATTAHGTIYGDKFYFISKQAKDGGDTQYTPGGRLVVADAKTLQKIAGFDIIGGDGRSFLGVNKSTGYIGASNGIYLFDIAKMQMGSLIPGTGTGQIGNMIRTSQYVFAVKQTTGIFVIDPSTNTVINTIAGAFHSIVQAKDGSIWAIQDQKLVNVDATTFATTVYAIPTTKYLGSWGAWNAGPFTYSNQQNALYWINSINSFNSGTQIVKFDVATKTFNENFATLPGQTGTYKQIPYGAALRIDPVSDKLILNTTESGYGAHYQKNWVHTFDNTGSLTNTKVLNDYYWYPSITVFPDNTSPVVNDALPSQVSIIGSTVIDLKTVVSDADNLSAAIVKSIKSNSDAAVVSAVINTSDELILTPKTSGNATVVISFNSNGKVVEKTITVDVPVPTFTQVDPICSGGTLLGLPTISNNNIVGTWSPELDNTATTIYTFTPTAGIGIPTTTAVMTITVNQKVTPTFTQVAPICSGSQLLLPVISNDNNGISGTWSPALNNTATTEYTFTPTAGQCATTAKMTVTVNQKAIPTFTQVAPICFGTQLSPLSIISNNEIKGAWSANFDNTATRTYTFLPSADQCATAADLTINVLPIVLAPTGDTQQAFADSNTVSDIVVHKNEGTDVIWYKTEADALAGTNALLPTTPLEHGNYYAMQTVDGCRNTTPFVVTVTAKLGTDQFDMAGLRYYPNPVKEELNVSYSNEISSVEVFNLLGQHILVVRPNALSTKINMADLPIGTYLLQVSSRGKLTVIKVVKN